jgi:hypothetical protein
MGDWKEKLSCAVMCSRCEKNLASNDVRILSVYDHNPICMECKGKEEERPDYEEHSREMIGACIDDTERLYSDPGGYCYHHFYPFKC